MCIRRALTVLVLAGGLAAVFATAWQAPSRRALGPSGPGIKYGPTSQSRIKIGQTSCALSRTNDSGGGAICTTPRKGSLPPNVLATVHQLLHPLTCGSPTALTSLRKGYVIICPDPKTHWASFELHSPDGSRGFAVSTVSTVAVGYVASAK